MKKIVVLLMFVKVLFASTLEVSEGNVTVIIGGSKRVLPPSTKIELDTNVTVCYVSGEGKILIEDMSRSSKSKDKCYTTQKEKKFDLRKIIANYLKNTIVKLLNKSKDNSVWTLFRGGKNKNISGVVTLHKGEEHLVIESNQWSPYPMTLRIYNAQNIELQHITKYIDDYNSTMVFDLNRNVLGDGYRVTVENKYGQNKLDIRVELK